MKNHLQTLSAGPVTGSRPAVTVRTWIRHQVVYNRDLYWTNYQSGEGHILEIVVAPVEEDRCWNYGLPTNGRRRIKRREVTVTMTRREDGLIHLRMSYRGPDESMSRFRMVAADLIPVNTIDEGRTFQAKVLPVKYWRRQPWHTFSQETAVA